MMGSPPKLPSGAPQRQLHDVLEYQREALSKAGFGANGRPPRNPGHGSAHHDKTIHMRRLDQDTPENAAGPVSDQLKQAEITEKEPIPRREDIFVVDHRIKYASDDQVLMLLLGQNRVPTEFTPLGMKGMRKDPVLSQKCRPMIWHRRSAFHKVDQIGLSLTARERERIEFNFRRTHWHIALTGFFFSFIGVNDMARTTDQSGKFVLSPIAILFMNLGTIFTGILIYTIYRFYTFLAWWSPDGGALLGKDGLPLLRQPTLRNAFIKECAIAAIHPLFSVTSSQIEVPLPKFWREEAIPAAYGEVSLHFFDIPVMIGMTLRLFFLFKYIHVPQMLFYISVRLDATANGIDPLHPSFLILYFVHNSPIKFFTYVLCATIFYSAAMFRLCERVIDYYVRIEDAVWYISVSALGVHPGEYFVKTDLGRFCVVCALVLRTVLFMAMVPVVKTRLIPSVWQQRVLLHCRRMKFEYEHVQAAGRMLTLWWKLNRGMAECYRREPKKAKDLEARFYREIERWHNHRVRYIVHPVHHDHQAEKRKVELKEGHQMLHQLHLKFDQWLNAMGKKVLVINHELVNKLRTTLKSQKVDEFEARLEQEEQIMIERYRFLDQKLVELEVNLEKREKIFIEIALANGLKVQPLAAMKEGGGGNLRERRTGIVNPKEFRVRIAEQHNQKAV